MVHLPPFDSEHLYMTISEYLAKYPKYILYSNIPKLIIQIGNLLIRYWFIAPSELRSIDHIVHYIREKGFLGKSQLLSLTCSVIRHTMLITFSG